MKGSTPNCDMNGPEWAFRNLTRTHHMAHSAVFDRLGLKIGQPLVLFVLRDMQSSGQQCTQSELANILKLSPPTITMSIKALERQGLVYRRIDQSDMRRNFVEITEQGLLAAETCSRGFSDVDEVMYAGFSPQERELVTSFFNRMTQNLEQLADAGAQVYKEECKCSQNSFDT